MKTTAAIVAVLSLFGIVLCITEAADVVMIATSEDFDLDHGTRTQIVCVGRQDSQ